MANQHSRMPAWGWLTLLFLLAGNIAMAYLFVFSGRTETIGDQRTAILLSDSERNLVLGEMRQFLVATQGIAEALSREDMDAVAEHARRVGAAAAQGVPGTLAAKLPLGFKQLGSATHRGFDEIAIDAQSLGDPGHALEQLGTLLNNCIACHGAYQLKFDNTAP